MENGIRSQVIEVLKEVKPTRNLEIVQDIVEGGYIDSFELMLLITTISERFNVEITIEDITPENFNNIEAICSMVERLLHR